MEERLIAMGLDGVTVSTFHALGLRIIAEAAERKPSLSPLAEDPVKLRAELRRLLEQVAKDPRYAPAFQRFMLDFYYPRRAQDEFASLGEYYEFIRAHGPRALSGERVRSFEELAIANFLFANGVHFEYAAPYRVDIASGSEPSTK